MRFTTTQPDATTRPSALMRSVIPSEKATLPMVFERSFTTQPARATSHWGITLVKILPQAITISRSAIQVLLEKPMPSISERKERRLPLLSPALAGQPFQQVSVIVDDNGHLGTTTSS